MLPFDRILPRGQNPVLIDLFCSFSDVVPEEQATPFLCYPLSIMIQLEYPFVRLASSQAFPNPHCWAQKVPNEAESVGSDVIWIIIKIKVCVGSSCYNNDFFRTDLNGNGEAAVAFLWNVKDAVILVSVYGPLMLDLRMMRQGFLGLTHEALTKCGISIHFSSVEYNGIQPDFY
jgi:hypothetical protein